MLIVQLINTGGDLLHRLCSHCCHCVCRSSHVVVTSCCRLCSDSSTVTWNCRAVVVLYQHCMYLSHYRFVLLLYHGQCRRMTLLHLRHPSTSSVVSYHADLGPYFSQLDGRKDNFIVHRFDSRGTNLQFLHQLFFVSW
jgi:hypothetical protein